MNCNLYLAAFSDVGQKETAAKRKSRSTSKNTGIILNLPSITEGKTTIPVKVADFPENSSFEIFQPRSVTTQGLGTSKVRYYLPGIETNPGTSGTVPLIEDTVRPSTSSGRSKVKYYVPGSETNDIEVSVEILNSNDDDESLSTYESNEKPENESSNEISKSQDQVIKKLENGITIKKSVPRG